MREYFWVLLQAIRWFVPEAVFVLGACRGQLCSSLLCEQHLIFLKKVASHLGNTRVHKGLKMQVHPHPSPTFLWKLNTNAKNIQLRFPGLSRASGLCGRICPVKAVSKELALIHYLPPGMQIDRECSSRPGSVETRSCTSLSTVLDLVNWTFKT